MATRAKAQPKADETEIFKTAEELAMDDEELPISEVIQSLVDEYSAEEEIVFKIYRAVPGKHISQSRYIATLSRDEFSEDRLQQPPFNGGDFRVWIRGKSGVKRNMAMSIEPLPVIEQPKEQNDTNAAMLGIAQMMMAGFKQTNDTIINAIGAMKQSQPQGMDVNQTISLIGSLSGLMGGKSSGPDPFTLMAQAVNLVKGLQPDPSLPKDENGQTDMMGAVVEMVKSFAPVVQDMVNTKRQQANGMQGAQPPQLSAPMQTPVPAPQPVAPVSANITLNNPANQLPLPAIETQPTEDEDMFALRMMMPMILLAAKSKADVKPYADNLLTMASDALLDKYIDAQDWFEQLSAIEPQFAEHKEWLTQLRDAVIKGLHEES